MQEEASFFHVVAGWIKDNFEWVSWVVGGVFFIMYRIHRYFTGINRLAESHEKMAEKIEQMAEKQEKMVDAEGVDRRVAPVIETVKTIQGQISQIHDHMFDTEKKRRHDDSED